MKGLTYLVADRLPNEDERELAVARSRVLTSLDRRYLSTMIDAARARLRVAAAGITIIYQDWAYMIVASGFSSGVYPRTTSLCAHAINSADGLFVIPDAQTDDRFSANPYVDESDGIRFYAAASLVDRMGFSLGTVCCFDGVPRRGLAADESHYLKTLANSIIQEFEGIGVNRGSLVQDDRRSFSSRG